MESWIRFIIPNIGKFEMLSIYPDQYTWIIICEHCRPKPSFRRKRREKSEVMLTAEYIQKEKRLGRYWRGRCKECELTYITGIQILENEQ